MSPSEQVVSRRRSRRPPRAPLVVVVHPLLGGRALVPSRSEPGTWHVIAANVYCDCAASAGYGRLCSHERALSEYMAQRRVRGD